MESLWPDEYPPLRGSPSGRPAARDRRHRALPQPSPAQGDNLLSFCEARLDDNAATEARADAREACALGRPLERNRLAAIGRLGGLAKSARHDCREATAPARAGLRAKFLAEADPAGTLCATERERRATALMRLHMARLALRSAQVRSGRHT